MLRSVLRLLLAPALLVTSLARAEGPPSRPRNVVLVIGDGMGLSHLTAGLVSAGGHLAIEGFPVVGLSKTSSADALVTDSAAAATAMACGVKTRNGSIGVDADGCPVPSLLELARAHFLRTGVVVTSSLTDATPAAFLAHRTSRKLQDEIALDVVSSGADLLVGGGRCFFTSRPDRRYLLGELAGHGYTVVEDPAKLEAAPAGRLAALLAEEDLPRITKGRGSVLPAAVAVALRRLPGEEGFFLLVEASQIDSAAHDNDARGATAEVVDLDRTVARILQFAAEDGETLVVLTTDHETGGLALTGGSASERNVEAGFVAKSPTATMVPVFAFGPGAGAFAGVYENTAIFAKLRAALNL
jgi:alkaline phosphatase